MTTAFSRRSIARIVFLTMLLLSIVALPALTHAQTPPAIPDPGANGVVPQCDPSLPPNDPAGCGVNAFAELIQNIINYLTFIAFPIAALMIGWGGIQIMTAAGNTEKVSKGLSSMKIAATGLVIILASYLMVQFIFKVLGVVSTSTPGGI